MQSPIRALLDCEDNAEQMKRCALHNKDGGNGSGEVSPKVDKLF